MFGFNRYDVRLLLNLFKMNVRDRYLGSSLGSLWAIVNPLFMLCLYTYVFGFIFKVRLPGAETTLDYVVWLISGYGPWIATAEAVMASASSVFGASGMVKNMAFKTELLPIAGALIGTISLTVSSVFVLILMLYAGNTPTWHVILLPVVIVVQFAWIIALGMWLSAITVFVRDLMQVLPNLLTVIVFVTPIFYPFSSMPSVVQKLSLGNPFYHLAESYRSILIGHQVPNVGGLIFVAVLSAIVFYFGLAAFRRAKGYFDSAL